MKKLFGQINMTWLKVILFAVIAGVYTGLIMLVPFLSDTSFQDIGALYEWWVIFAVIVVVNCKKNWEAMLKCFVFFLISQPIIYGVEILLGSLPFETALMYYKSWIIPTFLTLPGGFIAYYCNKNNIFGAAVMGLGNTILGFMGLYYGITAVTNFPRHILSSIVCFAAIVIFNIYLQTEKKYRIISVATTVAIIVIVTIFLKSQGLYIAEAF